MRNEQQIREEIGKLQEERKSLPEYSALGDPNWEIIDTEIKVLEWALGEPEDEE